MSLSGTFPIAVDHRPQLPPQIQAQLPGIRVEKFRPLLDVKAVLAELGQFDIDADSIYQLAEMRVFIAFDIATRRPKEGSGRDAVTRRELRVLRKSVEHFVTTSGKKYHELEWPQIFRRIIAHQKPIVTGLEIRRALICDRGHIENLVRAGHLVSLKDSQPGPGGTWTISRDSYENFLKGRQL